MTFEGDLAGYLEQSSALIDESPQMDEQNTKRKIIEPLIELLGWNILSAEVELEYSVQMGAGTKKVDYTLKLEETPVVFIEAKGCDTTLTEAHSDQLCSYMRQVGVDWGLLSNGREFEIYRRDTTASRPSEVTLAQFSLEEIEENQHPLRALSKESISSGESRQIAEKIESVQKAVTELRENKEMVAEEVTGIVTHVIGESVSQLVEDEAKNFVDNLIASLDEQAHRAELKRRPSEPAGEIIGEYVIRVSDTGSEVSLVSGETQAEASANFVGYLIEKRGLLEEIEIPYVPGTGRGKTALINEEPVHTNGDEMRQYSTLSRGFYLYTSLNAQNKIRYITELAEKMGLECEFIGEW